MIVQSHYVNTTKCAGTAGRRSEHPRLDRLLAAQILDGAASVDRSSSTWHPRPMEAHHGRLGHEHFPGPDGIRAARPSSQMSHN